MVQYQNTFVWYAKSLILVLTSDCYCFYHLLSLLVTCFMQNLKEFLSFAEGEVRSLASLYSTVVRIPLFLLLFCITLISTFQEA